MIKSTFLLICGAVIVSASLCYVIFGLRYYLLCRSLEKKMVIYCNNDDTMSILVTEAQGKGFKLIEYFWFPHFKNKYFAVMEFEGKETNQN